MHRRLLVLVRETQRTSQRSQNWGHFLAEATRTAPGPSVSITSKAGGHALPGQGSRVPQQELTCPRATSPSLPSGKRQNKTENEWKMGRRCPI